MSQFLSKEDRDYFVFEDPAHQAFKKAVAPVAEDVQVLDFEDGTFVGTS